MRNGISIGLAAMLMACGVAATSNGAAESATQKARPRARPQPQPQRPLVERFDEGGMAGCFDPNLSGFARAAAERIGGVPCDDAPAGRATRSATPSRQAAWIVGRWIARGSSCQSDGGIAYYDDGSFNAEGNLGRWQLNGNSLIETALSDGETGEDIQNPQPDRSHITSIAANRNAFTVRYADGRVFNMVRCR
jgi:hypothetical protein